MHRTQGTAKARQRQWGGGVIFFPNSDSRIYQGKRAAEAPGLQVEWRAEGCSVCVKSPLHTHCETMPSVLSYWPHSACIFIQVFPHSVSTLFLISPPKDASDVLQSLCCASVSLLSKCMVGKWRWYHFFLTSANPNRKSPGGLPPL